MSGFPWDKASCSWSLSSESCPPLWCSSSFWPLGKRHWFPLFPDICSMVSLLSLDTRSKQCYHRFHLVCGAWISTTFLDTFNSWLFFPKHSGVSSSYPHQYHALSLTTYLLLAPLFWREHLQISRILSEYIQASFFSHSKF